MALLRTRRLGYHTIAVANTPELIYTCPAGFRAVVRDVRIGNQSALMTLRSLLYVLPSGSVSSYWLYDTPIAANAVAVITGDVVLEAGDALGIYGDPNGQLVYACGAELTLPP